MDHVVLLFSLRGKYLLRTAQEISLKTSENEKTYL